jgi:DNA-binding MarR family transcriptional regulator
MPNTRTIDWELQLGFLIHDTSRLRRSAFDRFLRPLNITRSQWWVLAHLSRGDGLTQSDIAEQLDLGRVAIGGLIDRLEKNGLVRRVADPNDRRVNRIYLDARSKPLLSRMRHANHSFNARILEGLTDEQLVTTAEALETMKRNLLKYLDSSDRTRGDAAQLAGARPLDSASSESAAHPAHDVT